MQISRKRKQLSFGLIMSMIVSSNPLNVNYQVIKQNLSKSKVWIVQERKMMSS